MLNKTYASCEVNAVYHYKASLPAVDQSTESTGGRRKGRISYDEQRKDIWIIHPKGEIYFGIF